ncbi:MAG TPA: hypothetical protein VFL91_09230 [Thermomicrobiales bacterium]|nr:hypothetical protein [Thermomicrobiales bacterium]
MAALLTLYTAVTIAGWVRIGMPNRQGLGHVAIGLGVALLVTLLAYLGYQAGLGLVRRTVRVRPA